MTSTSVHRFNSRLFTGLALFTLLALGACNFPQPGPEEQPTLPVVDVLPGTVWYLTAMGPVSNPAPAVPGHLVTIEFGTDNTAGGSAGCNSYGGTYQVQDGTITFSNLNSTLMACEDAALMDQETRYLIALSTAGGLALTNGQLLIFYGEAQVLQFSVSPPIAFENTPTPTSTSTAPSPTPATPSVTPSLTPSPTPSPTASTTPSSTPTSPATATAKPSPSSTPTAPWVLAPVR